MKSKQIKLFLWIFLFLLLLGLAAGMRGQSPTPMPPSTGTVTVNLTTKVTQPPVGTLTLDGAAGFIITRGSGSPNGAVTASPGSMYLDQTGFIWFKQTGTGNTGWSQPGGGGTITMTGDVTGTGPVGGTIPTHLTNIPSGTTAAGYIQFTNTSPPGTPPTFSTRMWFDSTDNRLHDINSFGNIATTVVPQIGTGGQYVTGVGSNGVLSFGTPAAGGVTSFNTRTGAVVPAANDYSFAQLSSHPTTLAGYGITDPVVLTSNSYTNPAWINSLAWGKITGAPAFEPALGNPAVNGYVLSSTTAGVRSWIANGGGGGGTPGGANTDVQYNNSGAFGGDSGLVYATGATLTLTGSGTQVQYVGGDGAQTGAFGVTGASYTALGAARPNQSYFYSNGTGGISFLTTSGPILMAIGSGAFTPSFNFTATLLNLTNATVLGWSSNSDATTVPDIGLYRNASGVLEIDNGTVGSYRDLIVRNLTVNGTCTGCGGGGGAVTSVFGRTGAVTAVSTDYSAFYPLMTGSYVNPAWITSLPWSKITATPTTLAGYGITNAEPSLGNPSVNGYVLSSTTAGVRSWVANGTGGGVSSFNSRTGAVVPVSGDYSGFDNAFTVAQSINLTPASSNTVAYPLTITNNTTGIASAGLGTGFTFAAKDSTTAGQELGEIDAVWSTATHATRTSFLDFWLQNGGTLTDVMRAFGDGGLAVGNTVDLGTPGINLNTSGFINWSNDTALYRQGSGVLEVDNGTAGQLRDLSVRNLSVVNSATVNSPTVTGDSVGVVFVKRLTGVSLTTTANNATNIIYTVPSGRTCLLDAVFQVTTAATSATPTTQAVWQIRCSNGTNLVPASTNNANTSAVGALIQVAPSSGALGVCPAGSTVNVNINTATSNATQTADFTALLLIY